MAQPKKRILVVDDERDVCRTLQLMLENYGFDIDCYTDSTKALEKFKPNLYDLTILDIRMDEPNGFALYDELKTKDPNIKTLFITALNSVEAYNTRNSKVYPSSGKRHFMKKPVNTKDLLEQVYSMMSTLA
jgi:CheY-like chemotaxis protein